MICANDIKKILNMVIQLVREDGCLIKQIGI